MTIDPAVTAQVLVEALPYLRTFRGRRVVVKYGGHAMVAPELKDGFAQDIVLLSLIGLKPTIVHGGGPQIGQVLDKMKIECSFIQGMRVTDGPTMDVVEMVLGGKINAEIVCLINGQGGRAVGLTGKDDKLIQAEKMIITKPGAEERPPEIIDLGQVGRVVKVNPEILNTLDGFIPVIAPVGIGPNDETFNINADLVAGGVAGATKSEKLILLTDVAGVLDNNGKLISSIKASEVEGLIADGVIKGGMIPKLRCCLDALAQGVTKAHIIDGRTPHAVLLELFTDQGIGTQILQD